MTQGPMRILFICLFVCFVDKREIRWRRKRGKTSVQCVKRSGRTFWEWLGLPCSFHERREKTIGARRLPPDCRHRRHACFCHRHEAFSDGREISVYGLNARQNKNTAGEARGISGKEQVQCFSKCFTFFYFSFLLTINLESDQPALP